MASNVSEGQKMGYCGKLGYAGIGIFGRSTSQGAMSNYGSEWASSFTSCLLARLTSRLSLRLPLWWFVLLFGFWGCFLVCLFQGSFSWHLFDLVLEGT